MEYSGRPWQLQHSYLDKTKEIKREIKENKKKGEKK